MPSSARRCCVCVCGSSGAVECIQRPVPSPKTVRRACRTRACNNYLWGSPETVLSFRINSHINKQFRPAKTKGSICLLVKYVNTVICLCTAELDCDISEAQIDAFKKRMHAFEWRVPGGGREGQGGSSPPFSKFN